MKNDTYESPNVLRVVADVRDGARTKNDLDKLFFEEIDGGVSE